MTIKNSIYDYKREVLEENYDEAYPVRNWLLYKQQSKVDCDKIALAEDLNKMKADGYMASADTLNSFWTTYLQAIEIWYKQKFSRRHPENNIKKLLKLHDQGEFKEVNQLFAEFAILTHTRGNFMLMPVFKDKRTDKQSSKTNFNLYRNSKKKDYWDISLLGIQTHEFDQFFYSEQVAPIFNIAEKSGGFHQFIEENYLDCYLSCKGSVRSLWSGHLDSGASIYPKNKDQIKEFLENVCFAIQKRNIKFTPKN